MDLTYLLELFCLLIAIRPVLSRDGHNNDDPGKQFDVEGVFCKALHHSGKLMCVRPRKEERGDFSDRNADRVVIEFDSLQERNRGGNSVGKVGRRGHLFNAFADQVFTFSPLELASYQGLRVKNFNFTSTLSGPNATLRVMAYMFQDEGNITFGNETSEMRKGMLKFNIQIENWKFCGNNSHEDCNTGDEGEFVDVTLVIKSKGKPKPHEEDEITKPTKHRRPRCFKRGKYNKCPKEFDIGGGSEMMLSSQVMVDNEIRDMPGNGYYPKFIENENKQKFIFRFPKAASRILYDPGLEVGEDSGSGCAIPLHLAELLFLIFSGSLLVS